MLLRINIFLVISSRHLLYRMSTGNYIVDFFPLFHDNYSNDKLKTTRYL